MAPSVLRIIELPRTPASMASCSAFCPWSPPTKELADLRRILVKLRLQGATVLYEEPEVDHQLTSNFRHRSWGISSIGRVEVVWVNREIAQALKSFSIDENPFQSAILIAGMDCQRGGRSIGEIALNHHLSLLQMFRSLHDA